MYTHWVKNKSKVKLLVAVLKALNSYPPCSPLVLNSETNAIHFANALAGIV